MRVDGREVVLGRVRRLRVGGREVELGGRSRVDRCMRCFGGVDYVEFGLGGFGKPGVDCCEFGLWWICGTRRRSFGHGIRLGQVNGTGLRWRRDGCMDRSDGIVHGGPGWVRREECERLHQLVAFCYGYVAIVQLPGWLTVHVEPPVALQYRLVKQRRLGAQETLLCQTVVGERAHVEDLNGQRYIINLVVSMTIMTSILYYIPNIFSV